MAKATDYEFCARFGHETHSIAWHDAVVLRRLRRAAGATVDVLSAADDRRRLQHTRGRHDGH